MAKIINISKVTSNIELPDSTMKSIETSSNESIVENMNSFTAVRSCNTEFVIPAQEITQIVTLTNECDVAVKNIMVKDTISKGANFKNGTVSIGGESKVDADPTVGIQLDSPIEPNNSVEISYTLAFDAEPTTEEVYTLSEVSYDTDDAAGLSTTSNTLSTEIVMEKLTAVKTSTLSVVIKGQTMTYQIDVTNEGNIKNTDIVFTDPLPAGVTFVADSVKIDEVVKTGYDPRTGFSLPDLEPNEQTVVKFDVTID